MKRALILLTLFVFATGMVAAQESPQADENEITGGIDELGVLLYGHEKNALWFGSRLSIEETRDLESVFMRATKGIVS